MSTMTLTQDICYLNLQLVFGRIELGTNICQDIRRVFRQITMVDVDDHYAIN